MATAHLPPECTRPPSTWCSDLFVSLTIYYLSGIVVFSGVLFGHDFLKPSEPRVQPATPVLEHFFHFDGSRYRSITLHGYDYNPERRSTIVFFPLYPLAARGLLTLTDCSAEFALLVLACGSFAGAFILLSVYTRCRYPNAPQGLAHATLLAFGFFPTTLFFRLPYSESFLVFFTLFSLVAMERRWPTIVVAMAIGFATAARPVGIALVPVFALHLWQCAPRPTAFLVRTVAFVPVACSGLLLFMAYQHAAFGEPCAFVTNQAHWSVYAQAPLRDKILALATLEPLWGTVIPASRFYWVHFERHDNPFFSMAFANALSFVLSAVLTAVGLWKKWLNAREGLLAIGFLLLPYLSRGYDNALLGGARFTSVVVPTYLVLGHLLRPLPPVLVSAILGVSGFLLGVYSALFSAGYRIF